MTTIKKHLLHFTISMLLRVYISYSLFLNHYLPSCLFLPCSI